MVTCFACVNCRLKNFVYPEMVNMCSLPENTTEVFLCGQLMWGKWLPIYTIEIKFCKYCVRGHN